MSQVLAGYSKGATGSVYKAGGWVSVDWNTGTLALPADATGYSGNYDPYIAVNAANAGSGGVLAAGTYTITFSLLADGVAVSPQTGLTGENLSTSFFVYGNTVVIPEGAVSGSLSGTVCADSTKIAAGDVIKAELYFDDGLSNTFSNYWETRSAFKPQSDSGFRPGNSNSTATVTQYDLDNGLGVRISGYLSNLVVGSEHDLQFKLFNSTTDADVSGSCAPAKPSTPTVVYSMNSLRLTGKLSSGSQPYATGCYAYDKTAPAVIAARAFSQFMMGSDEISCSFSGLTTGHTYFTRVQTYFYETPSELSDKSADVLIPAGGYTFTTNYAGTVAAGKVVKVSDNVLPLEELTSYTQNYSDGKGGLYTLGAPNSCTIVCGTTQARIRHFNADKTLDSTFGSTGSIVVNSFIPSNSLVNGMGYYGTNKDKWILPVSGYDNNTSDQKVQIILGNTANATTTS
jgi:hypothetical protein